MAVLLFVGFFVLVAAGQRGGDTFFSNPWLSITMLGAAGSAVTAGGFGVHALRHHDRSFVSFLAVAAAAIVILWTTLEIAFPH